MTNVIISVRTDKDKYLEIRKVSSREDTGFPSVLLGSLEGSTFDEYAICEGEQLVLEEREKEVAT